MRTVISIVCFLVLSWLSNACQLRPVIRANEGTLQPKSGTTDERIPFEVSVEFEGVSFSYDPRVFGSVTNNIVPEHKLVNPSFRPDGVAPECIQFEFELGRKDVGAGARIAVYPLDRFDDVYATSPHMVGVIKKEIAGLRKVLKDASFRLGREIPHLEWRDAGDDLYVKVRDFDFPTGSGVIFVTHWSIEPTLLSNRNLIYRFEGITADGKYYVTAETPVSVAFLPDDEPEEFEGYTYRNLYGENSNSKDGAARIEMYRSSILMRLEELNSNDYSPNLEKFERIISSLRINSGQNRER